LRGSVERESGSFEEKQQITREKKSCLRTVAALRESPATAPTAHATHAAAKRAAKNKEEEEEKARPAAEPRMRSEC